jgi:hypothetical protein
MNAQLDGAHTGMGGPEVTTGTRGDGVRSRQQGRFYLGPDARVRSESSSDGSLFNSHDLRRAGSSYMIPLRETMENNDSKSLESISILTVDDKTLSFKLRTPTTGEL